MMTVGCWLFVVLFSFKSSRDEPSRNRVKWIVLLNIRKKGGEGTYVSA